MDLARLRELIKESGPLPWRREGPERFSHGQTIWQGDRRLFGNSFEVTEAEFDLVIEARNALPEMLAMVQEFHDRYYEMKRTAGAAAASSWCHEFACMSGLLPPGESLYPENHGLADKAPATADEEGDGAMTKKRRVNNDEELVAVLGDAMDTVDSPNEPDEVNAFLEDCGHDPEEVGRQTSAFVDQLIVGIRETAIRDDALITKPPATATEGSGEDHG